MNEIRRFTKEDWYGYGGAEKFSNDTEPFIYERVLNDGAVEMVIIVDATGIEVNMTEVGSDRTLTWIYIKKLTAIQAEGELRHLVKHLEEFTDAPDISYELDHSKEFAFMGEL